MFTKLRILIICATLASATTSSNASDMYGVKIANLEIATDLAGDAVFIQLDVPKSSFPSCQTNTGWHYVLSLGTSAGKHMYAMLLVAKAQQLPIRVRGTGQCDVFGSIETATGVALVAPQ